MPVQKLIGITIGYFHRPKWIEHSLKVFAYAQGIGAGERVDSDEMMVLCAAALLHDIGIPVAKARYGDEAGRHQEEEGALAAPALLREGGIPEAAWGDIVWLIGHHHQEALAPGRPLLQILMEADYLVNLVEGNVPGRDPAEVLAAFFRTGTGSRYLRDIFGL